MPESRRAAPVPRLRRVAEVGLDTLLVFFAYYGAFLLRYDWALPDDQRAVVLFTMPVVLFLELGALQLSGVYRELWRYARVEDLLVIVTGTVGGTVAAGLAALAMYAGTGPSRGALVLNVPLFLILVAASRLAFRLLDVVVRSAPVAAPGARPVLIYGAGDGGALLLREILGDPGSTYLPIGFLDDDAGKRGRRVQGLRIFGHEELPGVIDAHGVHEVLVSSREVDDRRLADLRAMGMFPRRMSLRFE